MKRVRHKIIVLLFFTINCSLLVSQINLVPNGSFESFSTCPFNTAQIGFVNNWTSCGASTDYYNACAGGGFVSVPLNVYGYQSGADGNGIVGMNSFVIHDNGNGPTYYREPAGTFLIQTLNIGTKYYVSFKVALTINNFESCCASNKIGARFSTIAYSPSNPAPVNNFAHVYSNAIITDTLNWTVIKGSFVADSAYSFIAIGNFFDSLNTSIVDFNNDYPNTSGSYYYIDDVRVSTDSNFVAQIYNVRKKTEPIDVFPNPTDGFIFIDSPFNEFTVQIIDQLGKIVFHNTSQGYLDLSYLNNGIYCLIFKKENVVQTKKVIINK